MALNEHNQAFVGSLLYPNLSRLTRIVLSNLRSLSSTSDLLVSCQEMTDLIERSRSDIVQCYNRTPERFALDTVKALWQKRAPLRTQNLQTTKANFFWNVCDKNVDTALFLWEQHVLSVKDFCV